LHENHLYTCVIFLILQIKIFKLNLRCYRFSLKILMCKMRNIILVYLSEITDIIMYIAIDNKVSYKGPQ